MDRDMMQLADILVDWCDVDLEGDSFAGASSTVVAQTMVKCLAFTLAHDQNAREVLDRIVRAEMAEIRARFEEDDRRSRATGRDSDTMIKQGGGDGPRPGGRNG